MREKKYVVLLASAAALTLALHQGAMADTDAGAAAPAVQPAQPAPATEKIEAAPAAEQAELATTTDVAAPPPAEGQAHAAAEPAAQEPPADTRSGADAARQKMEQHRAEMMEQRKRRYEELRARASALGLELPETPPWEQAAMSPPGIPVPPEMPTPPDMPAMPTAPEMPPMPAMPAAPHRPAGSASAMTAEERDALREERYRAMRERAGEMGVELPESPPWKLMTDEERNAHREMMRSMTPEQRDAMRGQHWAEMRKRGAENGIELPETPPWKQAEQRREEMRAKWESYREVVEQMTEEQREAAAAMFARPSTPPMRQGPPPMRAQPPYGPGRRNMQPTPQQMPRPHMMPGYSTPGYGAPGYGAQGGQGPRYRGEQPMMMPAPRPDAGYDRRW